MSSILPFPIEFLFFGLTLLGIAVFHHHSLYIALGGMLTVVVYKLIFTDFDLGHHLWEEHLTLVNLLGLLLGFSILAKQFEDSRLPLAIPNLLPDDWRGGLVLLIMVTILSAFLDNIAAALIGGTLAKVVYRNRVHIGFLAAIVAASNAGGAGSVVGDTTTTMMWIEGKSALEMTKAYLAVIPALALFGYVAAKRQQHYQKIMKDAPKNLSIDWVKIGLVVAILIGAILTNIFFNLPAMGVWIAILLGALVTSTPWHELPGALKGTIFLLSLVFAASMMPVEQLPPASWPTAMALGFISAVFDNIPLTKLALEQGGYDWGILAFAVGFGGSMTWFGSSAGVALSNIFPEARSVARWVSAGWFIILAYILGFFVMLILGGWQPELHPG